MALISTRALILQSFPYSDTSKILRLFCLEHGLRSVIAKGALRAKNRFGGLLEPFTEGEAQFNLREGRDLHTLSGFDLLRSRQSLGRDLGAFAGASLLAELVLRLATEEPHPQLFHSLTHSLDRLADAPPGDAAPMALAGVWEMVSLLGFRPELEHCVNCGRALEAEEAARFDVEAGGASCLRCRPSGRVVDPLARREVLWMCEGAVLPAPPADRGLHRALLRAFLDMHLTPGHPLRALPLFAEQMR